MTLEAFISVKVGAADVTANMLPAGHFMVMIISPFFECDFTVLAVNFGIVCDTFTFFSSHIWWVRMISTMGLISKCWNNIVSPCICLDVNLRDSRYVAPKKEKISQQDELSQCKKFSYPQRRNAKKKQQGTEDRGCKMEDAGGGVKSSKWSGRWKESLWGRQWKVASGSK